MDCVANEKKIANEVCRAGMSFHVVMVLNILMMMNIILFTL
jgi:hypothetical protein